MGHRLTSPDGCRSHIQTGFPLTGRRIWRLEVTVTARVYRSQRFQDWIRDAFRRRVPNGEIRIDVYK